MKSSGCLDVERLTSWATRPSFDAGSLTIPGLAQPASRGLIEVSLTPASADTNNERPARACAAMATVSVGLPRRLQSRITPLRSTAQRQNGS